MIDGVLPRSRDLSVTAALALNCALADNDAETNIGWSATNTAVPGALASLECTP
jgi:hypothetical protein